MNSPLLELLGIWGIADSIWLAFSPSSWAGFWGRWISRVASGGPAPRVLALIEFAISLAMLSGRLTPRPVAPEIPAAPEPAARPTRTSRRAA
jgi:hypothetical protein